MWNVASKVLIVVVVLGAAGCSDDRAAGRSAEGTSGAEPGREAPPATRWDDWEPGLEINTLWLNRPHPWLPVVTRPGEQRRIVLDVDNKGFDTARNVVVRVETGARLEVKEFRSVYEGQKVECAEDEQALTCRLGDIPGGDTFYVRMDVTPLAHVRTVPVSVTTDTAHLIGESLNSATLALR